MANRFTRELRELRDAPPGTRFQEGNERTRVDNRALRVVLVVLGFALMVAAAVTFWVPGPNFVLVLAGLALVGGQSQTVARAMDRGEVRARRWNTEVWDPYPHKGRVRVLGALVFAAVVALLAWVAYRQGWLPAWLPFVD
ncbi:MAG: hypothetical protein JWM98_2455 [Thermoleophilia bacterium]|nr:hypothetical protein [Thermoleophilia bacterium]